MEEDYNMDAQEGAMNDQGSRLGDGPDNMSDSMKDFGDQGSYDEPFDDEDGGNFRNNRGRGNFRNRGRGPPPGWMNGPPMRFRGRGYGPAGPPMRGRAFFRTRGGPRFSNQPNFDGNWGPMGPPPPGMMGGPPPFGPPPGMMPPGGPMGPPPNMMGQPPPFGGPPGMPPPNMPAPEVWVETKSEDGKSYYYHSRSRETTWTRPQEGPNCKVITQHEVEAMAAAGKILCYSETTWTRPQEGPNCKVITQHEVEAMAAAGQMPGMPGPGMGAMGGPMGMPGLGMNNGMMPQMLPNHNQPPFMSQPPPWNKEGNKDNDDGQPQMMESDETPPGESPLVPTSMPGQPPGPNPFPGGPGPSFSNAPPSFPPNMPQLNTMPPMGQPGQHMPGQPMPGQTMPGQGMPGQPMPGQGMPGQPMPGQGMPGQPMPGPGMPGQPMPGQAMPGQGMPGMGQPGQPAGGPPGGFPGAWGGWGGWPPPLVANPPPNLGNAAMPDAGAASQQMGPGGSGGGSGEPGLIPDQMETIPQQQMHQTPHKKEIVSPLEGPLSPRARRRLETVKKPPTMIPPELEALAAEWTTHRAPDGRPYYYHAVKQESVWEKPKPMKDLDELQAKIQAEKDRAEKLAIIKDKEIKKNLDIIDVEAHEMEKAAAEAKAIADRERAAAEEKEQQERERLEKEKAERDKVEREIAEKEQAEKEKEKAKADKSRPISSTPISGTPWCVVWTGDGRVFFYNPTAHSSVWERPPQLIGRQDVDKAVSQPPPALQHLQKKEEPAASAPKAGPNGVNGDLKRTAHDSSDDSDSEPIKKNKAEDAGKRPGQIDLGKEAAIEAEVRAARERGVVPHSQRLRSFLAMLHEKQVSAFSTWEKELHKIVFDPRYLMLNSKERRQVFDQYVRERAEEERKEKKNRLQQKKQAYRTLMEEAKLQSKCSFTEFATKHARDERFKAIEKVRDRELYFNEYIVEVRKKEKEEKEKKRDQAKLDFIELLKEKGVDRHARFSDIKKKIDSEPRYKAVEGGAAREDIFREYCKQLKDDRRKDKDTKERDRSNKKEKKEKDRDKEKDKEGKKEKKKEKENEPEPKVEETPVEENEAETEEATESDDAAAKEREARAQASIKEREKEVQRALATSLRDRDKEREHHKRDEAVQHFNALLADLVRNPELSWREAKKQLKKDHRYTLAELLTKDDKERLFSQHTATLASKRRDKLRAILTQFNVTCTAHWRHVKEQLKSEPTTPAYSSEKQMEREFRDFQRDKQSAAKTAFRQLLVESRNINHRSLAAVRENDTALQQIHQGIKHSPRYTALEHIPEEREAIMMSYLEELEKKGPPPPPTATEPSRRTRQ